MSYTRTILVECRFVIPVEVPIDPKYDAKFDIEENHCPGTGRVGAAIDDLIAKHKEEETCWACAIDATNRIVGER